MMDKNRILARIVMRFFTSVASALLLFSAAGARPYTLVVSDNPAYREKLAVKELRRYLYLRTNEMMTIARYGGALPGQGNMIVVGVKDAAHIAAAAQNAGATTRTQIAGLSAEQYLLNSYDLSGRKITIIAGGDSSGMLYGAYGFCEKLGVWFDIDGDVVPDSAFADWAFIDGLNEVQRPLFNTRGIQPFHDFPEGPDWWDLDDYKAINSQLAKMRMNILALHTYPEGGPTAEPTVWIGTADNVNADGTVKKSYPSSYASTTRSSWGYQPKRTGTYAYGASQLFEADTFTSEFMDGLAPWPATELQYNRVFNRSGALFNGVFTNAKKLGVKSCLGTEAPLTVPANLRPGTASLGTITTFMNNTIAGTTDQDLYRTLRYDLSSIVMPCRNGVYKVTLKFCEPYYSQQGKRVFGVRLEGQTVISSLDLFARVGQNVALDFTFSSTVSDSALNVDFIRITEFPLICAIVLEGPDTVKVNVGGPAYKDYLGDYAYFSPNIQSYYEGIFTRIKNTHPLDYYWIWTPEGWTWSGSSLVEETKADLRTAYASLKKVLPGTQFATCGWVLGPEGNRTMFDTILAKDVAMSAINRSVGWDPVDSAFGQITGRPKWAIPWLEDDPRLTQPQFWVKRTCRDAALALQYGCTGLLGIHWRTKTIGPNFSALAKLAWDQTGWNADTFYVQWSKSHFGPEAAIDIGRTLSSIDGVFPQPTGWGTGPGNINGGGTYSFVAALEGYRMRIRGKGNLDRYDYWLNTMRYFRTLGPNNDRAQMWKYCLAALSTKGEMGTVMNLENHNFPTWQGPLAYNGDGPRLVMTTVRTSADSGEVLSLKARVLESGTPQSVTLYWRELGRGVFAAKAFMRVNRGVYSVTFPAADTGDLEYYVGMRSSAGVAVTFPATAPLINQTVVVPGLGAGNVGINASAMRRTGISLANRNRVVLRFPVSLDFVIGARGRAVVTVYTAQGRAVKTCVVSAGGSGRGTFIWDGSGDRSAGGGYIVEIRGSADRTAPYRESFRFVVAR